MSTTVERQLALARDIARGRAELTMTDRVLILRGKLGTFDATTGVVSGLASVAQLYPEPTRREGVARIHKATGEGSIALGEGQVDQRQVTVCIPAEAPMPQRDDLLVVVACPSDADMEGRALRVLEVTGGALIRQARELSCTMWSPSRRWSGLGSDQPVIEP